MPKPTHRPRALSDHQHDDVDADEVDDAVAAVGATAGESAVIGAPLRFSVDAGCIGTRLDKALTEWLPELSRSRLQHWISAGAVRVNGAAVRPRHALAFDDVVTVEPQPSADAAAFVPQPMALAILHEDEQLIVVDKPAGLVVHPAAGHWSGTLLNGLLAHCPALAGVPRAGIVHRLDAETSGLMVVAKTLEAQTDLVRQLQARTVAREYWAVVLGATPLAGTIDAAIARDPRNPLRFRVSRVAHAKPARTQYARVAVAPNADRPISWVVCRLHTGRTHQIRVHMESIGHPLLGDPLYRRGLPARIPDADDWRSFARQALHACRLALTHPGTGRRCSWFAAPPADLAELMAGLGLGPIDRPQPVLDFA